MTNQQKIIAAAGAVLVPLAVKAEEYSSIVTDVETAFTAVAAVIGSVMVFFLARKFIKRIG